MDIYILFLITCGEIRFLKSSDNQFLLINFRFKSDLTEPNYPNIFLLFYIKFNPYPF